MCLNMMSKHHGKKMTSKKSFLSLNDVLKILKLNNLYKTFKITPDCIEMITIATIECRKANNYEFCYPYTLGEIFNRYETI